MGAACSSDQDQKPIVPNNVEEVKPENVEPVQPYVDNVEPVQPYGDAEPVQPYGDRPAYDDGVQPVQAAPGDYGPAEAAGSVMGYEAYNEWIAKYDHTSGAGQYQPDEYANQYSSQDYGYQGYDSQPVADYSNQEYYY